MSVDIRNIAIIAHVDHGKTTLVDHLLRQSGTFSDHQQVDERLMDSMDLEKERGITIVAKNCSYKYEGIKVNIVDTPGHSDFGGEVERILDMVDGAILLVDASEGPLPQTRFVLKKALEKNLKIMVCINKIDRSDARPDEVLNEVFDLFIDLDADEEQADFKVVYAIARDGIAMKSIDESDKTENLKFLFDLINELVPPPQVIEDHPLQFLVSNIDYNNFVGRLAVGRVRAGKMKVGDEVLICYENQNKKFRISSLFAFEGNNQVQVDELTTGDIGAVAGMDEVHIGDCLTSVENPKPLPRIVVEEPTVGILMSVNDSPFAGLEGESVTSRKIKERLDRELLYNVAIRVEETDQTDTFKVLGRGELQLSVLVEQMRREGFELLISKPQVVMKNEGGQKLEPIEKVTIDVADEYTGAVNKKLGERKGVLLSMDSKGSGRTRLEFEIPARGLIGYRSEFLTDTRGTGLMSTESCGFQPFKGEIKMRNTGAIIADRKGKATGYALDNLSDRGRFFIVPGVEVYPGMIIGEHSKTNNIDVNVCKEKKLSNVRASGSDDAIKLAPVKPMTLEEAMEWINDIELIEVTPKNIRVRSRFLDPNERKRHEKLQASSN
ncbi:MAG: translational GTPase TypA [Bdellovibrionales bacterium]